MESRIHREVYVRFGGEHSETGYRTGRPRQMLSLQAGSAGVSQRCGKALLALVNQRVEAKDDVIDPTVTSAKFW